MKKVFLLFCIAAIAGTAPVLAKKKKSTTTETTTTATSATSATPATLKADDLAFDELTHDFGTVQEGPDATTKFTFTNKGNDNLVIDKAQASCGCTVPTYSKDPIAPGKSGSIDVAFHTLGKPAGGFTKTITITSNAGVKILTIKGNVEKAPATTVPEATSMVKLN